MDWDEFAERGERRQQSLKGSVQALVACAGRMCSGSESGIQVWNRATGEQERVFPTGEMCKDYLNALVACGDHLISGHYSGSLRVWNVLTGECEQDFKAHANSVYSLAVCGPSLVSGSADKSVKVWAMGASAPWACVRTLAGRTESMSAVALAVWRGKVVGGLIDSRVIVWDVATGARDATLTHHTG